MGKLINLKELTNIEEKSNVEKMKVGTKIRVTDSDGEWSEWEKVDIRGKEYWSPDKASESDRQRNLDQMGSIPQAEFQSTFLSDGEKIKIIK